jgi:hypothetical protein
MAAVVVAAAAAATKVALQVVLKSMTAGRLRGAWPFFIAPGRHAVYLPAAAICKLAKIASSAGTAAFSTS